MDIKLSEYFDKLFLMGIKLTDCQKRWYAKRQETLMEDMLREYPSYPEEAFASSQVGNWYASQMKELYELGHVTRISYDKIIPVNTASDLGQRDAMATWFFQINRVGEIMVIDHFEKSDFPLDQYAQMLNSKGYTYGTHIWPHDAKSRDRAGITFEVQAREFNLSGYILEQSGMLDGINLVRTTLSKMWFDEEKCYEGLAALSNYKKTWNNKIGGFTSTPLHDKHSNSADAMRYLVSGLDRVDTKGSSDDEMLEINRYWNS